MLSTKYRIHAVPGEALMDKTSGEIFIKRPSDGKVVSFFQNKQLYYDLLMEVRLNIANNPEFKSPISSDEFTGKSFMYSVNYDLANIHNGGEKLIDIASEDQPLLRSPSFIFGAKSNGFFIRIATRDCDKAVVEYATYLKDIINENTENDIKFNKNYCIRTIISNIDETRAVQRIFYGRLNETLCCVYPDSELSYVSNNGASSVKVTFSFISLITDFVSDSFLINSHYFPYQANVQKLRASDGRVELAETNIIGFIDDDVSQFPLPFYSHILAFLDSDIILDLLEKTKHGISSESVIININKPATYIWSSNCIWGEKIRDVSAEGVVTDTASATTFDALETYFTEPINLEGLTLEEIP